MALATIRKRKTKSGERRYQAIIRRRGVYRIETFGSRELALDWARGVERDIDRSRVDGFADRALAEAIGRYLGFDPLEDSKEAKAKRRPSEDLLEHAESDRHNIIHRLGWWCREAGAVRLRDITPSLLRDALDRLDCSPPTKNRYLAALSGVLNAATKEWQWMPANPCGSLKRRRENSGRVRMLTPEEREALLSACRNVRASARVLYGMVLFALNTGCRLGEIERLRLRDVQLAKEQAWIEKSKNGDARMVFVDEELAAALRALPPRGDGLVFGPIPVKGWRQARDEAKLSDWRFHDLRHDFASGLGREGFAAPQISTALGHRTWAMARRYAHSLTDDAKETMRRHRARMAAANRATPPTADDGRTPDPQAPDGG